MKLPPDQRPTAAELATGRANVCPKCGGALVVYKTIRLSPTVTRRYRACRGCPHRVKTRATEEIVAEIPEKDSKPGKAQLNVYREAG